MTEIQTAKGGALVPEKEVLSTPVCEQVVNDDLLASRPGLEKLAT